MQSDFLTNSYGIAHKTGTSYGYRDAFAFGYTPDTTIGVWVGRTDGTAMPHKKWGSRCYPCDV